MKYWLSERPLVPVLNYCVIYHCNHNTKTFQYVADFLALIFYKVV